MKIVQSLNKLGEILVIKKWKPIGTILMFDREQDMSKLYYGTWQLALLERSPIGVNPNSTDSDYQTAGNQFGEKKHYITQNELPKQVFRFAGGTTGNFNSNYTPSGGNTNADNIPQAQINLVHPVETVYFYKRTA